MNTLINIFDTCPVKARIFSTTIILILLSTYPCFSQKDKKDPGGGIVQPDYVCPGSELSVSVLYPSAQGGVEEVDLYTECSSYTVAEGLSWVSYTKSGFTVVLTISPNTGNARSGSVSIGGLALHIYQACGNYPGAAGTITGTAFSVCPGQTGVGYSVPAIANATGYTWTLPSGATIASGNNTNSITVDFSSGASSGNISVSGTNTCASGSASSSYVTVYPAPSAYATSDNSFCRGSTLHLFGSGGSSYSWTGPYFTSNLQNPTIENAQSYSAGYYDLTVTNTYGCSSTARTYVSFLDAPYPTMTGVTSVCANTQGNIYTTEAGMSDYIWTITGGTINSGSGTNTVSVTWGSAGTGQISVNYYNQNWCPAPAPYSLSVTIKPRPAVTIDGPLNVCQGTQGHIYSTQSGQTNYTWSITGGSIYDGGSSTNNTATILWYNSGTGHVTLNYTNSYGCSAVDPADLPVAVMQSTTINTQPADEVIFPGETAIFAVVATGSNLQYQWQNSSDGSIWSDLTGPPASGFNTSTLTITENNSPAKMYIRCRIASGCGTYYTRHAKFTVTLPETNYLTGTSVPLSEDRAIDKELTVGATGGSSGASQGAATYTIPIIVAPGTKGMHPELSITYNSLGGSGLLGKGFSLTGLSSVSRINKPYYVDGIIKPISMDATDSYALDGNRLVLTYDAVGFNGDIYKTEVESFKEITSYGTSGNGPLWFSVKLKNGTVIQYGNGSNSTIITEDGTVLIWNVTKVTDVYGNYIQYIYHNDPESENYLEKIIYTGNSNTQLAPYNEIVFSYSKRSDQNEMYFPGITLSRKLLLESIACLSDGQEIHSYDFKYSNVLFSHLVEIVERGENESSLNSTIIEWGETPEMFKTKTGDSLLPELNLIYTGDFNGDGIADMLTTPSKSEITSADHWKLFTGNSTGYQFADSGSLGRNFVRFVISDDNGDGIDDILWHTHGNVEVDCPLYSMSGTSSETLVSSLNTGEQVTDGEPRCYMDENRYAFFSVQNNQLVADTLRDKVIIEEPYSDELQLYPADFNGDGRIDYLLMDENMVIKQSFNLPLSSIPDLNTPSNIFLFDFNGDGKTDLATVKNGSLKIIQYNSETKSFELLLPSHSIGLLDGIGDFNGDGKIDFIARSGTTSVTTTIYYSTGDDLIEAVGPVTADLATQNQPPLVPPFPISFTVDKDLELIINDFNGDGKSDILRVEYTKTRTFINEGHFYRDTVTYTQDLYLSNGINFSEIYINEGIGEYSFTQYDSNHDGNTDLLVTAGWKTNGIIEFYPDDKSQLIKAVTTGKNLKTEFSYLPMSDPDVYEKSQVSSLPKITSVFYPINLLSSVTLTDNNRNMLLERQQFKYSDLMEHRQGKGFLGFSKIFSRNLTTGRSSLSVFSADTIFFNPYLSESYDSINGNLLSTLTNTYEILTFDDSSRYLPYNSLSTRTDDLSGVTVETSRTLDSAGNVTAENAAYISLAGIVKQVKSSFENYSSFGLPGSVTGTTIRGSDTLTSSKTLYYDSLLGHTDSLTQSYAGAPPLTELYGYDGLGNVISSTVRGGGETRRSESLYEPVKGRFAEKKINAMGDTTTYTYNRMGYIGSAKGISGLTTTFLYDDFGNLEETISPGSVVTTSELKWNNEDTTGILYYVEIKSPGKPDVREYYDILGRKIRTGTKIFSGTWLIVDTEYDDAGRVARTYAPYLEGSDADQYVEYGYDEFGRIEDETTYPQNSTVSYSYDALSVTKTQGGRTYEKEYDASGLLTSSSDPGGTISYLYTADDKIKQITSPSGSTITSYDYVNMRRTLNDIDAGATQYTYNALGELVSQEDARGNEQTLVYDALGRTVSRSFTGGIQTSYEYYPGNGLVKAVETSDGTVTRFEYDDLDRLRLRKDSIDINNIFTSEYSYSGSTDRIDSVLLNGSVKLKYQYNTNGYLSGVAAGNKTVWTAGSMNRYGIVDNFTLGNQAQTVISYDDYGFIDGISTTKSGTPIQNWSYEFNTTTSNLLSRTGLSSADTTITEYFTYDDLDRLLTYRIAEDTMKVSYDPTGTGNISGKSDAGTYGYNSGVHRVDSVANPSEWFLDRPYQEVEYNEFNKVSHIRDSVDSGVRELQITYGPSEQRVKTVYSENGQVVVTKYFAPGYEKEVYTGGLTRELYYISATDGVVAMFERKAGMDTLYYIHTDHLGSIDVITDTDGNVKQRSSFDPWGRRRNPADWSYENVPGDSFIDMGFTGHEHLDQFGLINMNGRVYDPLMAMFLSPDNFIQSPDLTQNFNRYAYCLNNPLKYFDPSGYRRVPDPPNDEPPFFLQVGGPRHKFNWGGSQTAGMNAMNPGFNANLWSLIATLWNNTPDGESQKFINTDRGFGHYEKEFVEQKGGVQLNFFNEMDSPNIVDNIEIVEKWVWDIFPNAAGQVGNSGLFSDGASFGTAVIGSMTTMVQGSAELTQADALAKINRVNRVIASEKAAFKTMGKVATGAKFLGSALGVVSIADHSTKAWNSFSNEGFFSVNGWLNVGKVGVDGALMIMKSNPIVLTISVAYGITDASGYLDYKP